MDLKTQAMAPMMAPTKPKRRPKRPPINPNASPKNPAPNPMTKGMVRIRKNPTSKNEKAFIIKFALRLSQQKSFNSFLSRNSVKKQNSSLTSVEN